MLGAAAQPACVRPDAVATPSAGEAADPAQTPGCPVEYSQSASACVDVDRIAADVRRVAHPRPPGSMHWLSTQSLCAETFVELGYEVEQHRYETGINVIGTKRGSNHSDEQVVVGAHYDHIAGCDGADDNASGVAGLLEIARVLAGRTFDRTLVLACWDEEERGMLGSHAWVTRARARDEAVTVYFNFDAIGVRRTEPQTQEIPPGFELVFPREVAELEQAERRGDFVAIISNTAARPFADVMAEQARRHGDLRSVVLEVGSMLLATPLSIDLRRSDHASFWDAGWPAVMITDTAEFRTPTYHCRGGPDAFETIDAAFVAEIARATTVAIEHALRGRDRAQ
jgi:Zn-dependent M28 family amino/carboxypeptidase